MHFAAGWHPSGPATLDLFFRVLLVSLNTFRAFADFDWRSASPISTIELAYIGSHTNEVDPEKRDRTLRRYALEAKRLMSTLPPSDDVIPLGPGEGEQK